MTDNRIQALLVLSFPIVLSIGIILIPVVPDYSDHALATEAVNETGRWFAGHIISAVAFGLSVLSVGVIHAYLKGHSYKLPLFILPIMAIGAGLYAAGLGADGIGPIAVRSSGSMPTLFFDGSGWYVRGTFMIATLFFGVGLISLVVHANKSHMIKGFWRYLIFISALIFVTVPAIPSGWGLLGEAIAAYGVFTPLGWAIWLNKTGTQLRTIFHDMVHTFGIEELRHALDWWVLWNDPTREVYWKRRVILRWGQ